MGQVERSRPSQADRGRGEDSSGWEITLPRWPRTRQGDKQAIAGNEAVDGQPDLRGAARCHQTRELLELMKPSQMWFRISQKHPARLGQMR
jgi:hypothetical protein